MQHFLSCVAHGECPHRKRTGDLGTPARPCRCVPAGGRGGVGMSPWICCSHLQPAAPIGRSPLPCPSLPFPRLKVHQAAALVWRFCCSIGGGSRRPKHQGSIRPYPSPQKSTQRCPWRSASIARVGELRELSTTDTTHTGGGGASWTTSGGGLQEIKWRLDTADWATMGPNGLQMGSNHPFVQTQRVQDQFYQFWEKASLAQR